MSGPGSDSHQLDTARGEPLSGRDASPGQAPLGSGAAEGSAQQGDGGGPQRSAEMARGPSLAEGSSGAADSGLQQRAGAAPGPAPAFSMDALRTALQNIEVCHDMVFAKGVKAGMFQLFRSPQQALASGIAAKLLLWSVPPGAASAVMSLSESQAWNGRDFRALHHACHFFVGSIWETSKPVMPGQRGEEAAPFIWQAVCEVSCWCKCCTCMASQAWSASTDP